MAKPEILVYITKNDKIVQTGNPLTLLIEDDAMQKSCVTDISKALRANVLQLKNGDYLIISD